MGRLKQRSGELSGTSNLSAAAWLERRAALLIGFDLLLGLAHVLWPDYRWGQGHDSYFRLDLDLTLPSWWASMQLVGIGIFAALASRRERAVQRPGAGFWWAGAMLAIAWSIAEMTRFLERLGWIEFPESDPYRFWLWFGSALATWLVAGAFLAGRLEAASPPRRWARAGWISWGALLGMQLAFNFRYPSTEPGEVWLELALGLAYLLGCTFLLLALGGYALRSARPAPAGAGAAADRVPPRGAGPALLGAVFGTTLALLFLQSLLLRLLNIESDYLTAHSVIAIALLGIALGGLAAVRACSRAPRASMILASLLLPVAILAGGAAVVRMGGNSLATAVVLMIPFLLGSVAITVALALHRADRIYGVDLLGAAAGVLLVGAGLERFREEGSLLLLAAFAWLAAAGFAWAHTWAGARGALVGACLAAAALAAWTGLENPRRDFLNVVRESVERRYPEGELLFSRSSLVGRYDVIRRGPRYQSLSALENGRITDTIRRNPPHHYQIDPRLPSALFDNPAILILGLSGDAITKTAKQISSRVYGVEINPAVVELQRGALKPYNGSSYAGIEVQVMDGRSYVAQDRRRYDILTLLNAHLSRGSEAGRIPSPEYLHTREAIHAYLERLTARGILDIEEVVDRPEQEPAVWKLLWTLRQVLLERGATEPARHFFIFQWHTASNNYFQILMKRTPFAAAELGALRAWLERCDRRFELERQALQILGPITTKTTVLHAPDQPTGSACSRLVRGAADPSFVRAHGLAVTTDDRPFHFDVDPSRAALRRAYQGTLLLALLPAGLAFWIGRRSGAWHPMRGYSPAPRRERGNSPAPPASAAAQVLLVILTGLAYFLIEVVLLQRFAIFLGSPLLVFTGVLATLLAASGLGSLWSGRLGARGALVAAAMLLLALLIHALGVPPLLAQAAHLPPSAKVLLTVALVAPLALLMGVPFPYVMRRSQIGAGPAAPALLFAINGIAGALAVPLTFNLTTAWGFQAVSWLSLMIYLLVGALLATRRWPAAARPVGLIAAFVVAALLAAPWWSAAPALAGAATAAGAGRYRIDALLYGRSRIAEDKVFAGGSPRVRRSFAWWFWLVRGNGRTILVDTGFEDPARARGWQISDYVAPTQRLSALGLAPRQVTDVILTHAHWDHMGGIDSYPAARIYIQAREVDYAAAVAAAAGAGRGSVRGEDLDALLHAEKEGRVERLQGDRQLFPGLSVRAGGAHTPGSQYVLVETLDGTVVLAGDAFYRHENNVWHRPSGSTIDPAANLAAIQRMQALAASPFLIIPGHEPELMEWFPKLAEGVVAISMRGGRG